MCTDFDKKAEGGLSQCQLKL